MALIKPHGSDELNPLFVYDTAENEALQKEAEGLTSIVVSSATAANAVMMGAGYFNPLTGYMNKADALSVAADMKTTSGLFWPTPVLNLVKDAGSIKAGDRIALKDPNVEGNPVLAVMDVEAVEEFSDEDMAMMSEKVYAPSPDEAHPGVEAFNAQGKVCLSGPIKVLNFSYFQDEFPDTFRTAVEIRNEIAEHGWKKIVAFQTRNPMHLAHEELCHMAMDRLGCDGLVIHMLLGKLKPGDIPAPVRDAAIRKMVELYFPNQTVQWLPVTVLICFMPVHAKVYCTLYSVRTWAQLTSSLVVTMQVLVITTVHSMLKLSLIMKFLPDALEIEIFKADHTAYSKKLDKVVMMCEAPDHKKEDFVLLSGTKVREMLGKGIAPPKEFSRPEVADILISYYQSIEKRV